MKHHVRPSNKKKIILGHQTIHSHSSILLDNNINIDNSIV
jgi:hypothetical protein